MMNKKGITGIVWAVFIVVFVMTIFGFLVDDFKSNYIDTGISNATAVNDTFKTTFSNSSEINNTFSDIEQAFRKIEDASGSGFFGVTLAAIEVVPKAIIKVPVAILNMLSIAGRVFIQLLNQIGLPPAVILIISVALLVYIIFKLIEFWRRYPVGA